MIGAVVVAYNPDFALTKALLVQVQSQVDKLIIVDNSPQASDLSFLPAGFDYIHFPENVGIAKAQNQGIKYFHENNYKYVLLLDQDSNIPDDMVFRLSSLLEASEALKHDLIAIGPQIRCSFTDKQVTHRIQRDIFDYEDLVVVSQIIASGMMINLKYLDKVGYKEESLFIDGVDHEWCWRAKQHDLAVAKASQVEMVHRLGDRRSKFFGINYKVGSPIRLYYQFRNILILSRRGYVPIYWKIRCLGFMPIRLLLNSIMQEHKLQRLKYMLKGLFDGLVKRTGPYLSHWK